MSDEGSTGPNSKNPVLKLLGIATATIVALTALIAAIKHFTDAVKPEPEKPLPVLASTDVGNIKGSGHTVLTECEKQRQLYAVQNPDFNISIDQNVQPSSDKDILGTVTYTFHCRFIATRKTK
jgi:hypothetical protein